MPRRKKPKDWYQLLGVPTDASTEEIKAAWRRATDDAEPGGEEFTRLNTAAGVLLDPGKRAAYDAGLGIETPAPAEEVSTTSSSSDPSSGSTTPEKTADEPTGAAAIRIPAWLTAGIFAVAIVVGALGLYFAWQNHQTSTDASAGSDASAAAQQGLPVVLSYDYRTLPADRDAAVKWLTPSYAKQYKATFDKLIESNGGSGPAQQTKAVVKATVLNTGVIAAQGSNAKLIVFVDQTTRKGKKAAQVSENRLTVSMIKRGGKWLIDDISSY